VITDRDVRMMSEDAETHHTVELRGFEPLTS